MSRWSVAGFTVVCAASAASLFAATYSLIAWLWERQRA